MIEEDQSKVFRRGLWTRWRSLKLKWTLWRSRTRIGEDWIHGVDILWLRQL